MPGVWWWWWYDSAVVTWRGRVGLYVVVYMFIRLKYARYSWASIDIREVLDSSGQLLVAAGADSRIRGRMMPCVASTGTVGSRAET